MDGVLLALPVVDRVFVSVSSEMSISSVRLSVVGRIVGEN